MRMFGYCWYAWSVFLAVWLIAAAKTKPTARTPGLLSALPYRVVTWIAFLLVFWPAFRVGILGEPFLPPIPVWGYAGLVLTVAGIAFACWARCYLGGNWSADPMVKQHHELIRTGPYAIVRHPIYTGILLALLGTSLALDEVRGILAFAVALIGLRLKSRIEENLMAGEFPADYPPYMREVKALVPFVW